MTNMIKNRPTGDAPTMEDLRRARAEHLVRRQERRERNSRRWAKVVRFLARVLSVLIRVLLLLAIPIKLASWTITLGWLPTVPVMSWWVAIGLASCLDMIGWVILGPVRTELIKVRDGRR